MAKPYNGDRFLANSGTVSNFSRLRNCSLSPNLLDAAVRMPRVAAFISWQDRIVRRPGPTAESRAPIVLKSLLDLHTRIHHEGSVLHNGFSDRSALQEQEFGLGWSVVDCDLGLCPKLSSRVERDDMFSDSQCIASKKIDATRAA